MICIRRTTDTTLLHGLAVVCLSELEAVGLDRGAWWIAWSGTRPAGFGGVRMLPGEPGAYLCMAGVLPWARGQHLQRRLIRTRVNWARRQGVEYVLTDTANNNYRSANNLIACGFRLYAPAYRWGFEDGLYWIKHLTK